MKRALLFAMATLVICASSSFGQALEGDHVEVGVFTDYFGLQRTTPNTNYFGLGGRAAFNVSQHHLIQVAFAHIERVILEQFIKQVAATTDPGCKAVLTKLCQLFALS